MQTPPKITIYTDGACAGNPGPGGWGAVLQFKDKVREIFGYEIETTNNKMETKAAIEALKMLKKPCVINLYTDSKYLHLGITNWIYGWLKNNWRKHNNQPVKNADLWQELYNETKNHAITWHWVKGHAGNAGNHLADKLAVMGREVAINELKHHW